jgi:alcohol oxidase
VRTPAFFFHHREPERNSFQAYESTPSPEVGQRRVIVTSARLLGGGSSVNLMMYTRASASDYDDWKVPGWTFDDLKPFFSKVSRISLHIEVVLIYLIADRNVSSSGWQ